MGRLVRSSTLVTHKPLVLYFIKRDCPCSRLAAVHMQRLQDAYSGTIHVFGVIDTDAAGAKAWQREAVVTFPVLLDPFCEVIHAYNAQRSAHTTLVAPGSGIAKAYAGYNHASLDDLNAQIAGLLAKPAKQVSTDGAPTKLTADCTFPE